MPYLATLSQVKARLGLQTADVTDDDLLTTLLAAITGRAQNECNRKFEYLSTTEEFGAEELELVVERYPIDQTLPITFQLRETAAAGWVATTADYIVRRACVISLGAPLGRERQQIAVSYVGGYALPIDTTGGFSYESLGPHLPDELVEAAIQQVGHWYQNRTRLGLSSVSMQGGSISIADRDLLPYVSATLKKFERWKA